MSTKTTTANMVTTRSSTAAPPSRGTTTAAATSGPVATKTWTHVVPGWILAWIVFSTPLILWDSIYVLGRPHTMEGGSLHVPVYVPYKLYGEVDLLYGWKAYDGRNGFTGAQTAMNLIETAMYMVYAWTVYSQGREQRGAAGGQSVRVVVGRSAALAVTWAFAAAVMTVAKTFLYWIMEYFSGYDNLGHNDFMTLLIIWIIPNGAWLVVPGIMIYTLGSEIIEVLTNASTPESALKVE